MDFIKERAPRELFRRCDLVRRHLKGVEEHRCFCEKGEQEFLRCVENVREKNSYYDEEYGESDCCSHKIARRGSSERARSARRSS